MCSTVAALHESSTERQIQHTHMCAHTHTHMHTHTHSHTLSSIIYNPLAASADLVIINTHHLSELYLPLIVIVVVSFTGSSPMPPAQVRFEPLIGSRTRRVEVKRNLNLLLGSSFLFVRVALNVSDELITSPIFDEPANSTNSPLGKVHAST